MEMEEKFRRFQRIYRHPDGSPWMGADIERATHGTVTRHYTSKLRNGYYKDPSFRKIAAISRAMGIPLEEWAHSEEERPP
jgi:transcriptional regulator with XRE-family HTH domain